MVNLWHHSPHNAQKISMSWEEKGKKPKPKQFPQMQMNISVEGKRTGQKTPAKRTYTCAVKCAQKEKTVPFSISF